MPITDAEKARKATKDALDRQIIVINQQRTPANVKTIDDDTFLVCPFCESSDLQFEEETTITRSIGGIAAATATEPAEISIAGYYKVNDETDSDYGYLWCRECTEESRLPDEMSIDWS